MSFRHGAVHLNLFLTLLYSAYTTQALSCYKCSDFVKGPCFHPEKERVKTEICTISDVPEQIDRDEPFHCFTHKLYYHERGPVIYRGCVDDREFCKQNKRNSRANVPEEGELEDFNECDICEKDYCNSVPHKKNPDNVSLICSFLVTVLIHFV